MEEKKGGMKGRKKRKRKRTWEEQRREEIKKKKNFKVVHNLWVLQRVNTQICLLLFIYEKARSMSDFSHKISFKAQEHMHRELKFPLNFLSLFYGYHSILRCYHFIMLSLELLFFSPLSCPAGSAPLLTASWKVEGEQKTDAREALNVSTLILRRGWRLTCMGHTRCPGQ